mmetsp:Transcript_119376/g.342957  ORF Transcript_119376/g.342957 Transcript_119376/m.342957 type:complete len:327 (+) Transcript_119376:281-1261(+)
MLSSISLRPAARRRSPSIASSWADCTASRSDKSAATSFSYRAVFSCNSATKSPGCRSECLKDDARAAPASPLGRALWALKSSSSSLRARNSLSNLASCRPDSLSLPKYVAASARAARATPHSNLDRAASSSTCSLCSASSAHSTPVCFSARLSSSATEAHVVLASCSSKFRMIKDLLRDCSSARSFSVLAISYSCAHSEVSPSDSGNGALPTVNLSAPLLTMLRFFAGASWACAFWTDCLLSESRATSRSKRETSPCKKATKPPAGGSFGCVTVKVNCGVGAGTDGADGTSYREASSPSKSMIIKDLPRESLSAQSISAFMESISF